MPEKAKDDRKDDRTRKDKPQVSPVLLPGESGLDLKDDPYYGKVEKGAPPVSFRSTGPATDVEALDEDIQEGRHALDGEEQARIEVLTGKRLQQKTGPDPRPLRDEPEPDQELPAGPGGPAGPGVKPPDVATPKAAAPAR